MAFLGQMPRNVHSSTLTKWKRVLARVRTTICVVHDILLRVSRPCARPNDLILGVCSDVGVSLAGPP